jgi:hypothetical protein
MQIWNYNPATGELLGQGAADEHPLVDGEWIVPAFATAIAPPPLQKGQAAVFGSSSWSIVADHRGETWWPTAQKDNATPGVAITALGDPAALGLTKIEPPAPPVVVPPIVVTALQIRLALSQQGLRVPVEAYVATADQATKDSWQFTTSFERDNSMISTAAVALGKQPADVDALFALAKTL